MDYTSVAKQILTHIGGAENIINLGNCATRLRINLKDNGKVEMEALKQIKGVVGAVLNPGQLQVIIGPDVGNVCKTMRQIGNLKNENAAEEDGKKPIVSRILDTISGIFTPILPAIVAAGMMQAVIALLTNFTSIDAGGSTMVIFNVIANAAFYFLPVMIAFSAAKKFNCNPFMAVFLAGILLHPDLINLLAQETAADFFGIPVISASYASSVIPIILGVWLMSYVEKLADRVSPNCLKFLMKPLLTIIITAPITLIVLGPLGSILGGYLAQFIQFLNGKAGWLVITFMGCFTPFIVMTGMHYSLFPLVFQSLATFGYETIMSVGSLPSNMAQGAACFAVALKTKNSEMRQIALSAGVTAVLGITEPALYGVTLKLKRPLAAVMAGGAAGGLYAGLVSLKAFGFVTPGLTAFPVYIGPNNNLLNFGICCVIAFAVAFALTWILGFEDDVAAPIIQSNENKLNKKAVYAPVSGQIIELKALDDKLAAKGLIGKGTAIQFEDKYIYAPIDGTVTAVFPESNELIMKGKEGIELLIHLQQPQGMEMLAALNQEVKKGDQLAQLADSLSEPAIISVLVSNSDAYLDVLATAQDQVTMGDIILNIV
ncbi:PTS transporter subunit EIIC [Dielma fastidiosa]|uniref:PTS transporter subunit EIIC n=1 Tax=Dielma fastidiosa TaxID=1034346 RepID=UPI000E498669|nr:PTS transporter subunit EIIC [Dielma fastidiosa]RHN01338.1 PTS beta-glucoside transporter subunit EIIBCA [Dielma fastidiosa]